MRDLRLDQTDALSLSGRDSKGNRVVPVFDAPPVWTNSNDAAATIAPSADGAECVVSPAALGATTVGVTAIIGGHTYTSSLDITVNPGAIVGIDIIEAVSP